MQDRKAPRSPLSSALRASAPIVLPPALAVAIALLVPLPTLPALLLVFVCATGVPLWQAWHDREQVLEQRQAHLTQFVQRLIDVIPEPIYLKDAHSRFIMVNRAFAMERQRPAEEVVGKTSTDLAPNREIAEMVEAEDRAIIERGAHVSKEYHSRAPVTGEERIRLVYKRPCLDARGKPIIVGAHFDITSLRQTERELQQAAQAERTRRERVQTFVQRLIDVIPDPVYVKDRHSRYLMVNAAFARERGMEQARMIGLNSLELAPDPFTRDLVEREDRAVLAGEGEVYKEQHTRHPVSGAEVFRVVTKRLSEDPGGEPVIVGAHFDLTKWKLAERKLESALTREREQRERVAAFTQRLIDVIPQPVYVKSADSRYLMVNAALTVERKLPAAALIGRTPLELTGMPERSARVVTEDQQVLAGRTVLKEERSSHPVTGEDIYRLVSKGSCLDADGLPVVVGCNFNITEWREAEARLQVAKETAERASEAKSLFLASMSHEIRTPLSGVIGILRIALCDTQLTAQTRDYLQTSLSNAESLLAIINDILDFSKIEAGQLQLELIDFDLQAITRDSLQAFRDHALSRELQFNLDLDPALPRFLKGDPLRVRQILLNLVGNAVKFTERGTVSVSVKPAERLDGRHRIAFRVEDTGIGIAEEALPHLFQKFQQADVSTTRRFGGTGLGLAICRQLVEAMGGRISVRSSLGAGSVFDFDLLFDDGEELAEAADTGPLLAPTRRLRILCAEDVAVNQIIVKAQITALGHDITLVADGLAAVRALAEADFDVVLMDGRMPHLDGADAARAIRAGGLDGLRVRNPQIHIVALTANASKEDREQYLAAGMDDYLSKPVSEHQLHAALERAILRLPPLSAPAASGDAAPAAPAPVSATPADTFRSRLVEVFVAGLPDCIADMDHALAGDHLGALGRVLHSLHGSASVVGLEDIGSLCERLEKAVAQQHYAAIEDDFPRLRAALRTLIGSFA